MKRDLAFLCLLLSVHTIFPFVVRAQTSHEIEGLKQFHTQLYFEENKGQFASEIRFQAHVQEAQIRFLEDASSFALVREVESANHQPFEPPKYENYHWMNEREADHEALVWNLRFVRTQSNHRVTARHPIAGQVNYFLGQDPSKWTRGVKRYQELWYENLFPQVDLRYYGNADHKLKYDFIVKPGGQASSIHLQMDGIQSFQINEAGELVMTTEWGEIVDASPYAYQFIDGQEVEVPVQYQVQDELTFGFAVLGGYNPELPLIIDPITLNWASFLHSSSSDDYLMATVLDEDGYVYVSGYTKSLTFPVTPGIYQNTYGGGIDNFVAKMTPMGTSLVYATYLGGADWELAYGVGIDANNNAYVAGFARSSDYPTTAGSLMPVSGGGLVEGFVSCLNATGDSLIYSTYLGGSDRDYIYDLRVDPAGSAYVTGYSLSADFPTTGTAYQTSQAGNGDAFAVKLNPAGTALEYGTLLGGSSYDIGNGLALRPNGELYVVGNTGSTNFPTSMGAPQTSLNHTPGLMAEDAFITRISADGSTLKYGTYLGGGDSDGAYCIAVNGNGEAFISGVTYSSNFPTTVTAFMGSGAYQGNGDGFVVRLDSSGTNWAYSTYLGGTDIDFGKAIAVNSSNEVILLGASRSANFPVDPGSAAYTNMYDLFVSMLSADGSSLPQSGFFGGIYNDYPRASGSLYLKGDYDLCVAATTHSGDMPMTSGTFQVNKTNGVSDTPWIGSLQINSVLPAQLKAFAGRWRENQQGVEIEWTSETETAAVQYYLERKTANQDWQSLMRMAGQGERSQQSYHFLDQEAVDFSEQTLYYRLRYAGTNAGMQYSNVIAVRIPASSQSKVRLLANPVHEVLPLSFQMLPGEVAYWQLLALDGREMLHSGRIEGKGGIQEETIDVAKLPAGMYFLNVQFGQGEKESIKVWIR
jgi:hypothetical protein